MSENFCKSAVKTEKANQYLREKKIKNHILRKSMIT